MSILKKLHESTFQSLTLAGLPNWYDIVKANPDLEVKYLKLVQLKSQYIMVSIDYSQLELYVLASLSGDPDMIATVNSGKDLHDVNTEKVYGLCKADLTDALETAKTSGIDELIKSAEFALEDFKTKRKFIKALSFSLTYGAGVGKIAQDLKISIAEAQKLIDDFYAAYPEVKKWQDRTFLYAIQNGYVDTPFGRQRATPKVYKRNDAYYALVQERKDVIMSLKKNKEYWLLRSEQKVCKNTPVQSTATDMCSKAACKVRKWFVKEKRRATMMFWVHDAIVFSTHIDQAVENIKKVVDIMENDCKYPGDVVNYRTEAEVGYNYEYVAGIKRSEILGPDFTKDLLLKKLEESLDTDNKKVFKLVIKATGTSMDTLKQYTEVQRESKGDYFDDMVQGLGLGASSPDEYMSMMNGMSLTEYIDAQETLIDSTEDDNE